MLVVDRRWPLCRGGRCVEVPAIRGSTVLSKLSHAYLDKNM